MSGIQSGSVSPYFLNPSPDSVLELTFALSVDRNQRIGKYVIADRLTERLAVIAGGSIMDAAKDSCVLDLVDRG